MNLDKFEPNTGPWTDIDATTAPKMEIRKPINISRTMLSGGPRQLYAGDEFQVEFTRRDGAGNLLSIDKPPPFEISQPMAVDSITRFEVIDEFGLDVGIGIVLGQVKR